MGALTGRPRAAVRQFQPLNIPYLYCLQQAVSPIVETPGEHPPGLSRLAMKGLLLPVRDGNNGARQQSAIGTVYTVKQRSRARWHANVDHRNRDTHEGTQSSLGWLSEKRVRLRMPSRLWVSTTKTHRSAWSIGTCLGNECSTTARSLKAQHTLGTNEIIN